ncbi:MAG: hypothetical protein ACREF9_10630 [Opitutaceae bacterium]
MSSLDRHALYCGPDAHSLENLGREYTMLDIEPGYAALFEALRGGLGGRVRGWVKFPAERTRYHRNRCGMCQRSFDGQKCPRCGRPLAMGSRDRLEVIADRREPGAPPCRQLLPLADVIAELMGVERGSKSVRRSQERLLGLPGHERYILTEAMREEIAAAGTLELARRIVAQRTSPPRYQPEKEESREDDQLALGL